MRERTFTSYINAEVAPGAEASARQLERLYGRTFDSIQRKAAAASRATAGLTGGGISTGLARAAGATLGMASGGNSSRIAAANAAITATSVRTTAQLARQSSEIGRLERHNANLSQGLRSTATALQVVQGPLGPMAGRVTALSNAIERLSGFRLGLAAVGAALFAMTAAANHATELRQKLAPLYDTQEQVNDAFARTAKIAQDTRTSLEPVVELYARLTMVGRGVGLSERQIEKTTRAAALGARIAGGGPASSAALIQLSQAMGANFRGSGQEIQSILEGAPRIAKAIADGLSNTEHFGKVTIGMLKQLNEQGELTSVRVAGALGRSLHKLESEAKAMGPALRPAAAAFGTEFTIAISNLDQAVGLTRTLAGGIQFAADNMRELTSMVVGLGVAWAAMKVAPALVTRVRDLDTFIRKQEQAFRAGKTAAELESRTAGQNVAALTAYNAKLQEKQQRLQAVTRQAEQEVTATRARADNLAPQAAIEERGGFQAGAVRNYQKALRDAETAERKLIAMRREGASTTAAITRAEGQLAVATNRVEQAKKRAAVATSRWRSVGMNLLNAINPLGIAVALLTTVIIELALAESKAERNAKELEKIQRELADTVDDATGRIREQNKELRRGLGLKSQQAEGLAREKFAGEAGSARAAALAQLQVGTRPRTGAEIRALKEQQRREGRPEFVGSGMVPVYLGGRAGQEAQGLLQQGGSIDAIARRLDALARQNPGAKELRSAADALTKSLTDLTPSWRAVLTEQARQRELAGRGTENDRRILRGDFSGGRIEGKPVEQLNAAAEEERRRLRDPRYKANRSLTKSLTDLEGRRGTMSETDYIRERADVLNTYDEEIKQIERTEAASKKRADAEKARQERLAEKARDNAAALENLMQDFEDNAPVKQLEKVYDAAARGKRKLQDLIGDQVEGIGRFSAEDASRRMQQIDRAVARRGREFVDQTMDRFEDDTPIRRLRTLATEARKAKQDLDALVGRAVEGYQNGFTQADADRMKGEIDTYVDTERRRPFVEQLRQYEQQAAVQNLILRGREDEAAVLERAFELQTNMENLSKADLETLLRQTQAERERNQAIEQRSQMVANLVSLADDAKQTIEAALGEVSKGRPDRAFTTLFKGLTESYWRVQIRSVTDKLMAGADQRIKDLINGRSSVDASIGQITSGMDTAGNAALTFADRLREAAARVGDVSFEGAAGPAVPSTAAGVDAVVGSVLRRSETVAGRFLSIAAPLARMVVGGDNFAQHVARGSSGVDLSARVGTPVYAPFAGTLSWNHSERGGLQAFVTSLDGRIKEGFAHLSDITVGQVRQGVRVELGQMIAKTGNSGINPATGRNVDPHLHTSLYIDGRPVDPMKFIGKTIDFAHRGSARSIAAGAALPRGQVETQMAGLRTVIEGVTSAATTMAVDLNKIKGLLVPGNIDIMHRPRHRNPDGSISTVRSMSFGTDRGEVLVPTIADNGKLLSDKQAIAQYERTGKHLGIFATPEDADKYAQQLHLQQERLLGSIDNLDRSTGNLADATAGLRDSAQGPIGGAGGDRPAARRGFLEAMHEVVDNAKDPESAGQVTATVHVHGGQKQQPQPNQPSIRVIYNQMGADIGHSIDKVLGTRFAEKVGGKLGDIIVGAGKGQMASGIARMVGIKQSNTGAAVGGAIGQLAAPFLGPLAPFAPFIGGLIGGTIGGMFKKPKSGSSTVSVDQFGNFNAAKATGNDSASRQQAASEASSVGAALKNIADVLYGSVKSGLGSITLGYRASDKKQPYRIDPSGQGRTSGAGVLAFETEQEQITKAVQLMLERGVIDGISAASQKILQSGQDLQTSLEKATAIENIPRQLMQIQDPVRFAVMETNRDFQKLINYLKEGGASAEQFADASKLYDLERQKAIEQAKSQASDQITSFLNDMMGGSNSPLNRRTVYSNSRNQIESFASDINAGKIVDQGKLLEAARNFEEGSRALNGSGQDFFGDFDWLTQLLSKARDNVNAGMSSEPLPDSPFSTDPQIKAIIDSANGTNKAIADQTDVLGGLLTDIKTLLSAGGISDAKSGTSIGILPGFSTGGGFGGGTGWAASSPVYPRIV